MIFNPAPRSGIRSARERAIGHRQDEQTGAPEIFNTDQGSQFTSLAFTNTLKDAAFCSAIGSSAMPYCIKISMDGRECGMDDVIIERLWRSLQYECIFVNGFGTGSETRTGIGRWKSYDNADPPSHSSQAVS